MGKDQFVVKRGDKWAVVGANNERATRITDTQKRRLIQQGILRLISNRKCVFKIEVESGVNVTAMVMMHVHQKIKIINIVEMATFWQQFIRKPMEIM